MKALTALLSTSFVVLLSLGACTADGPTVRSPHWDKDGCARCRMAVSQPPFAAQLVTEAGLARHYDDLGCLIEDRMAKPELAKAVAYVLQLGSKKVWVRADQVRFNSGARTPMGYGFGIAKDGELSYADIVAKIGARNHDESGADEGHAK